MVPLDFFSLREKVAGGRMRVKTHVFSLFQALSR
jgi:hypothetical protein